MPSPDDYSLDPLQTQEDELNLQYKRALAKSVRQYQPSSAWDTNSAFYQGYDRASGERELGEISGKRAALSQQFQQSLVEALRGAPPDIQKMVMNAGTRKEGLALLQKFQEYKLGEEELNKYWPKRGGATAAPGITQGDSTLGGGGGALPSATAAADGREGIPSYEAVIRMESSMVPSVSARGKMLREAFYKGMDPKDSVRYNPDGSVSAIPGTMDAQAQAARSKTIGEDPMVDTFVNGVPTKRPRSEVAPLNPVVGGGAALPNATAAATASGPSSPATTLPAGSPATAAPPLPAQASPQAMYQEMLQAYQAAFQRLEASNGQDQQARATLQQLGPLLQNLEDQMAGRAPMGGGARPAGQPPAPTGQPPIPGVTQGANRTAAPTYAPGVPADPVEKMRAEEKIKKQAEDLSKFNEAASATNAMADQLRILKDVSSKPTYAGYQPEIRGFINAVENTFSKMPSEDPKLSNTRQMDALIREMSGPRAKMFGYNPSNFDLVNALAQLPTMRDSPGTRDAIIAQLERGLAYHQASVPAINEMVQRGGQGVAEAQAAFDKWWRDPANKQQVDAIVAGVQQSGRPAGPPPGQPPPQQQPTGAMPYGASAQQPPVPQAPPNQPPQAPPQQPPPQQPQRQGALPGAVAAQGQPPLDPSLTGMLTSGEGWRALGESVNQMNIADPRNARGMMEGAKDAYSNLARGAGQWMGVSDRADWPAEQARQKQKGETMPGYRQSELFNSIVNPTAAVGGGAGGIVKGAAALGLAGALHPGETRGDQMTTAALSAGLGALGSLVAKGIPATDALQRAMAEDPAFAQMLGQVSDEALRSMLTMHLGSSSRFTLPILGAINRWRQTAMVGASEGAQSIAESLRAYTSRAGPRGIEEAVNNAP